MHDSKRQNRKRVLVVMHSTDIGGSQRNAVELASEVRKHGIDVSLMAWRMATDRYDHISPYAQHYGMRVRVVRFTPSRFTRMAITSEIAEDAKCDLIHTYTQDTWGTIFWGPARFGRLPMISLQYEMTTDARTPSRIPLIVGTQYQHLEASKRPGATYLLRVPVDLERDKPSNISLSQDKVLRIVIVSRLSDTMKQKGIEVAIQAMPLLPDKTVLEIVGDGNAENELKRLGRAINLQLQRQAVLFRGAATEPQPHYQKADIVIGMGGSASRGLAHGKVLIVIGEQGDSAVFTPDNADQLYSTSFWNNSECADPVEKLAASIQHLANDHTLRSTLGTFGLQFARDHFALTMIGQQLAGIYAETIRSHRKRDWWLDAIEQPQKKILFKMKEHSMSLQ